jgi:hypothetical protein
MQEDRLRSLRAAGTLTIGGLTELAPEFFPERVRCPRRPIASGHFSDPLERMIFSGIITDADNDIPMEWACGGGTRRLQRVTHGRGQIVGTVVHRHENLQPAPKDGHQAARPWGRAKQPHPTISRQSNAATAASVPLSGFETSPGSPN